MGHGLVRDRAYSGMQGLGAVSAAARVDEHGTVIGDDQPERGVVAKVLGIALTERADDGIDIVGHFRDLQ